MKLLLDTHILLWALSDAAQLPEKARKLLENEENEVYYSEEHIFCLRNLKRPESAPSHKDPFDRILICQAMTDNMLLITHDHLIPDYNEPCIYSV